MEKKSPFASKTIIANVLMIVGTVAAMAGGKNLVKELV